MFFPYSFFELMAGEVRQIYAAQNLFVEMNRMSKNFDYVGFLQESGLNV